MGIAKGFGRVGAEENDIRTAFFVRLALSLLYGGADACAEKRIKGAMALSPEKTEEAITALDCAEEYKRKLRDLAVK